MRRMHLRLPRLQKAASAAFETNALPAAANEGKKKNSTSGAVRVAGVQNRRIFQ